VTSRLWSDHRRRGADRHRLGGRDDFSRAHLRADGARFNRAKRFTIIGAAIGFLVWFLGFMVVGGEWFSMWQSPMWNGQEAAFRFYISILAVLIFVNQPDGDLPTRARRLPAGPRAVE
jgi:predicted small integral membrane protein